MQEVAWQRKLFQQTLALCHVSSFGFLIYSLVDIFYHGFSGNKVELLTLAASVQLNAFAYWLVKKNSGDHWQA